MKFISTDIEDSPTQLNANVASQKNRPGFAPDNYFYRSQVTYARELDRIFYKSWLYAGYDKRTKVPESTRFCTPLQRCLGNVVPNAKTGVQSVGAQGTRPAAGTRPCPQRARTA